MTEDMMTDYDIRGTTETGLTIEYAWNVGKAMADWLPTAGNVAVVYQPVQHDIASAIIEGLRLQGRDVIDGGLGGIASTATLIQTAGLSGAALVSVDETTSDVIIELYQETGMRIEGETGLKELGVLIDGGNFVPAAVKGELTAVA